MKRNIFRKRSKSKKEVSMKEEIKQFIAEVAKLEQTNKSGRKPIYRGEKLLVKC